MKTKPALIHRLLELRRAQQLLQRAGLTCLECAAELEERQSCFDQRSEAWKHSRSGKRCARNLYRAYRLIALLEQLKLQQ